MCIIPTDDEDDDVVKMTNLVSLLTMIGSEDDAECIYSSSSASMNTFE